MEAKRKRDVAIAAAREAGALIRENAHRVKKVAFKTSESDLVTDIDKRSEEIIRRHILQSFPDHDILGEEGVEPGPAASSDALAEMRDAEHLWIVDPIDGTTNFVHGFPFFCVSIALAEMGEVTLGIVYDPMREEWFIAEKGKGATVNGERMRVSRDEKLSECLMSSGFPSESHKGAGLFALRPRVRNVRIAGSAALQLAHVAAGRVSGYWEWDVNAWDVAAGVLLVEEAGGRVTDTAGRPYDLSVSHILATNGHIHDKVADILAKAHKAPSNDCTRL